MASITTTTIALLTFSLLLSLSSSLPSSTILDAAEILSTSGFEAMALNLELASQTLLTRRQSHSLTVFAPTNFAFNQIPQLPLSLLRYHLLPHAFSLHSLRSLPYGANIPTLLPGHSLTVTTSNRRLSINNVTVIPTPLLADGYLIIFQTETFFDPYFQLPRPSSSACFPARKSAGNNRDGFDFSFGSKRLISDSSTFSFLEASSALRSRGSSIMASFLDMQFLDLKNRPDQITLFAPMDEAMASHIGNVTEYSDILRRHLVPCKIMWNQLITLEEGTLIWTYQRGFTLNVTKTLASSDLFLLNNGVPVIFPDLYNSDWLVVHGIGDILLDTTSTEESVQHAESSSSKFDHHHHKNHHHHHHDRAYNPAEHSHFSAFH
ncbi:putative fasciclin-like arabinogalactan protein 20 [Vicia villosa]|uniref:putative fasciclin-like arabinogalactan protein 20 n=1 Tax=Vicia villosa TaxID=3911 RepID=UPI00273BB32A|nr:putative fasciclin-like arabinogalactan protein 20 [Vicia villosa]